VTAKYATRNKVLTYLREIGEPRPVTRIIRYMRKMHRISAGATRTQLWRLHKAGLVERVGVGEYRIAPGGSR
jgi:predicted transcriptional regulator of viral defense system